MLIIDFIRVTAHGIETIRVIERGLRESRAVDTEALCIIAGEKVHINYCYIRLVSI